MSQSASNLDVDVDQIDFFISYTKADEAWAIWITWWLELAGYSVMVQVWDFRPGHNFVLRMQHATSIAKRTIIVLSESFLEAVYTQPEWAAAFAQDPMGTGRKLIPVRIDECRPVGLLQQLIYLDLADVSNEHIAARLVLEGVRTGRGRSTAAPPFPRPASL